VAADLSDAVGLVIAAHDLIRSGLSDGIGVLIEETIALRQQSVEVRTLADTIRRPNAFMLDLATPARSDSVATMVEWDGDAEAAVGFVAWGAAQGVVRDAVELCRSFGFHVAGLYPKCIVPFLNKDIESFASTVGQVVLIESGHSQGYWDRLRATFSFDYTVLTSQPGQSLTPMDIFLREGLGAS
jgi:hypothetical protein